jgi:cell division protein FtsB
MSRYLTIASQSSMRFGDRKAASKAQPSKMGGVTLNFIIVTLICMVGFLYIYEVNTLATKGFDIKKAESELEQLKKENENLNIRATELKSMNKIEEKTKDLNMVAPKDISYLNIPGNVAMK